MKKSGSKVFARRNMVAKDLGTEKYAQRVKEPRRRKLIDYLHRREAEEELDTVRRFGYNSDLDDYDFNKDIGLVTKE